MKRALDDVILSVAKDLNRRDPSPSARLLMTPLIRPSGTFSPRGGEKGLTRDPSPRTAGRGWREAPGEGRVITASVARRAIPWLRMTVLLLSAALPIVAAAGVLEVK